MSKEAEIIQIVADNTTAGKQKWEPTAVEDEFITAFGDGFIVSIKTVPDPHSDEPDYVVDFRDPDGRIVSAIYNTAEGIVDFKYLKTLHIKARRSALKVDETLDAMLKSLKPK